VSPSSAPQFEALTTLGVALLFAAVYLFGGRAAPVHRGHRRFLSFAAGVSIAYTFVHVLPALHEIRAIQTRALSGSMVFPEHGVYLWTMVGFLVFYGLETMAVARTTLPGVTADAADAAGATPERPWLHMGGFALYTWILTYMMVWTGKDGLSLGLFALAMGLHLFTIASTLGRHYRGLYQRRGAPLLAASSLAGWAAAVTMQLPVAWVLNGVAFVMGGVVVNAAIAELPREKEGRYWAFVTGAVSYTALLLILSRVEQAS
jgi:hypothetical protein